MDFDDKLKAFGVIAIIILVIGWVSFKSINAFHTEHGVKFTVTGKESKYDDKKSRYLVFNTNTTYEITDSWVKWRFDSSDVYGRLEVGKTYVADLQGFRIPFFSMYPNIINPVEYVAEK
jgi:hypothetical protein